jgi:hypothetical protein
LTIAGGTVPKLAQKCETFKRAHLGDHMAGIGEDISSLARLFDPRKPMGILAIGLPLVCAICSSQLGPEFARAHFPVSEKDGSYTLAWLMFVANFVVWTLVWSIPFEAWRLIERYYKKRRRLARAAKLAKRAIPAPDVPRAIPEPPQRSIYQSLDEHERRVMRMFIDNGRRDLPPQFARNEDREVWQQNGEARDRLCARGFLTFIDDEIGVWGGSRFQMIDEHFRRLSEHPDEIGSDALPKGFG